MEGYIAQVIMFAGNFAPRGWAFCQGQQLSIAQYTAVFALLGTTYGGNGQTTFGLPDMRGRVAVGTGQGPGLPLVDLGEMGGVPSTTLLITNLPAHNHTATFNGSTSVLNSAQVAGTNQQAQASPQSMLARGIDGSPNGTAIPKIYAPNASVTQIVPLGGLNVAGTVTVGVNGGSQPFSIMQPYLGMNFIICLEGIFPSRN